MNMQPFVRVSTVVVLTLVSQRAFALDFVHAFTAFPMNGVYTQDFNGDDFVASSTVPQGWTYRESGTNVNTVDGLFTDSAGQSNSSTARRFRFEATPGEAAFGTQRNAATSSDTCEQWIGFAFTNQTGSAITRLNVDYTGETWRVATANRSDGLLFEYSLDATALDNGTWIRVSSLDYFNPGGTVTNGSLGNVTSGSVSGSVDGLFVEPGDMMMIRWADYDSPVVDREDGIGVDDLTITPVPEPAGLLAILPVIAWAGSRRPRR